MTILEEAKEQSLKRWRKILDDCPDIVIAFRGGGQPCGLTYGLCGFCELYTTDFAVNCPNCPLYPKVCSNYRLAPDGTISLYWRIVSKLKDGDNRGLKQMIQKMIREIEKVDTSA